MLNQTAYLLIRKRLADIQENKIVSLIHIKVQSKVPKLQIVIQS